MATLKAKINGVWTPLSIFGDARVARGLIGSAIQAGNVSCGTSPTDVGLSVTWTADPTRYYWCVAVAMAVQRTSAGVLTLNVTTAPGGSAGGTVTATGAVNNQVVMTAQLLMSGLAGTQTVKVQGSTNTATADFLSSAGIRSNMVLFDMGAV